MFQVFKLNSDEGPMSRPLRGPGLIPGQPMWDLLWIRWQSDSFISQYFSFCPVNIIPPILHTDSFPLIHSFIHLSITNTI
jgi:hypothetical protein